MKLLQWSATLLLASLLGAQNNRGATAQTVQVQETRLEVPTPPTTDAVSLAISPDGDKIVFVASAGVKDQLWVHSLASGTARPLGGTEDVSAPFPCWSPDNKSIAYFGGNKLKRIDVDTGSIQTLFDGTRDFRGCTWNRDGTILFASAGNNVIFRISDQGGGRFPATPPTSSTPQLPRFLPDGRHFLYYGVGSGVYVGEVGGAQPQKLLDADSAAVYSHSGHLLFVRKETLYAQQFDAVALKLDGDAFPVLEPVPSVAFMPAVSTSAAGLIVYRPGLEASQRRFKWIDRTGKEVGVIAEPFGIASSPLDLSPDGKFLVMGRAESGNSDVWIMELATGTLTRITEDPAFDVFPAWSADSRTIYFTSNRAGPWDLYEKLLTGSAEAKRVMPSPGSRAVRDVSPDGRFLLYRAGSSDISAVQLDGNPPGEFPVVQTPGTKEWPQFSPDGRWVAYQSNESGRVEIYIQQFPSGRRRSVSTNGGGHPRWSPDGKDLFYIAPDNSLMAATMEPLANGEDLQVGAVKALFIAPIGKNLAEGGVGPRYVVSPDGQRFLLATVEEVRSPIKVIRNWQPKP